MQIILRIQRVLSCIWREIEDLSVFTVIMYRAAGDFTAGEYTTDMAVCDGACVKWLKKPTILAEQHSRFHVVPRQR